MSASELLRLGGIVFVAVTCVVLGDTAGKLLTGDGVAPVFVAWSRFALAASILLPFSGLTRAEWPALLDRWVLLRAALIACGIASILTALRTEPIADVFGAFFIGPIVSYGLAVMLLGEPPSGGRAALLGLGFAGVMLIVKPGFSATSGMAFALLAGVFYGAYLAATKAVASRYRPRFLLISQLLTGAVLLAPFGLGAGAPTLDGSTSLLILASALGSAAGNYLLVIANRKANASLIAPLVYTQLISATLVGILVFGDWPDGLALAGLAVITLSGLGSLALARQNLQAKLQ